MHANRSGRPASLRRVPSRARPPVRGNCLRLGRHGGAGSRQRRDSVASARRIGMRARHAPPGHQRDEPRERRWSARSSARRSRVAPPTAQPRPRRLRRRESRVAPVGAAGRRPGRVGPTQRSRRPDAKPARSPRPPRRRGRPALEPRKDRSHSRGGLERPSQGQDRRAPGRRAGASTRARNRKYRGRRRYRAARRARGGARGPAGDDGREACRDRAHGQVRLCAMGCRGAVALRGQPEPDLDLR